LPGYERSLDDVSREILEILAKNDSTSSHLMAPAAYALKSSSNYETSRTLFRAMNLLPTSPSIENAGCGVTAISGSQGS
jgi:hypothetical protein